MLCITMKPSDYFTVGENTVIQYDRISGDRVHLIINAPREVPVLRGDVLERQGRQWPSCVLDLSPRYVRQLPWNHAKKQALADMRKTLAQMGDSPETRILREKLDCIFPAHQEGETAV